MKAPPGPQGRLAADLAAERSAILLRSQRLEIEWAGTSERLRVRPGEPTARLSGVPGELLLYVFGRQSAAHVEVTGPTEAVAAVRRTHFGM